MTIQADVKKLRDLLAKATQYPAWGGWPDPAPSRHGTDHFTIGDAPPYIAAVRRVEDATLIAEMHRALPELLAIAEAYQGAPVAKVWKGDDGKNDCVYVLDDSIKPGQRVKLVPVVEGS